TQYGMTERLGAIKFGTDKSEPFVGREIGHERDYSEEVAAQVDEEVRKFIETAHQEAYDILVENRDILDRLVVELLDKETLDKQQVEEIFAPVRKLERRPAWTGSATRRPSDRGPVEVPVRAIASPNGAGSSQSSDGESGEDGEATDPITGEPAVKRNYDRG
ncbi:MAG: cell division protein FtsH, partial [Actinomycetota bacterium]